MSKISDGSRDFGFGRILELHSLAWGNLVPIRECPCARLNDRVFVVEVDKSQAPLPPDYADRAPHPTPVQNATAQLSGIPAKVTRILHDEATSAVIELELDTPIRGSMWSVPYTETFHLAVEKVVEAGGWVFSNAIIEGHTGWLFPQVSFSSSGFIVSKLDATITIAGTLWTPEAWLWAYDRGLLCGSPVWLRILAVIDYDAAVDLLRDCGVAINSRLLDLLRRPPFVLPVQVDWRVLGPLWKDRERSFAWEVAAGS